MNEAAIANYQAEQALFGDLVRSKTLPNILLLQGESGSGKSHFIEHCLHSLRHQNPAVDSVLFKLQSGGESIATLFTRLGGHLGWDRLTHFTRTVGLLLEQPEQVADPLWQVGMHRHLREIGRISDIDSRLGRYQLLADAWFADVAGFANPFLLAVDSYENSPTLFDRWFADEFLTGAAHTPLMRVLVGGRRLPTPRPEWDFCASLHQLAGIGEAEEWLAWANTAGYQVPSLEVLAGVVLALKGNPGQIVEVIKTQFPQSGGPVQPKATIREQRRQLRQLLTDFFSLSELKNICFDLEIDYENLPEHDQKSGFVRELLAYAGRIGRLHELIQLCREERPQLAW
jgi:hypothetical protein